MPEELEVSWQYKRFVGDTQVMVDGYMEWAKAIQNTTEKQITLLEEMMKAESNDFINNKDVKDLQDLQVSLELQIPPIEIHKHHKC